MHLSCGPWILVLHLEKDEDIPFSLASCQLNIPKIQCGNDTAFLHEYVMCQIILNEIITYYLQTKIVCISDIKFYLVK